MLKIGTAEIRFVLCCGVRARVAVCLISSQKAKRAKKKTTELFSHHGENRKPKTKGSGFQRASVMIMMDMVLLLFAFCGYILKIPIKKLLSTLSLSDVPNSMPNFDWRGRLAS